MQLNYAGLNSHLKQKLAPIYLVHGDEPLLVQEACLSIRNKAGELNFTEQMRFTADGQLDWETIRSQLNNYSLFEECQLIQITLVNNLNTAGGQFIQEYAKEPNQTKILLLISPKLTGAQLQTNWYKAILKEGVVVTVWPLQTAQFPSWISQYSRELGLKIAADAVELIADFCNGHLLAAKQLLTKLQLLANQEVIELATVQGLINDDARYSIFDLMDTCLAGNIKHMLRIVAKLRTENAEPTLLIWALSRELRGLINMAEQLHKGKTLSQVLAGQSLNSQRAHWVGKILQQANLNLWILLLRQTTELDKMVKGAAHDNFWRQFTEICLQFVLRKSRRAIWQIHLE